MKFDQKISIMTFQLNYCGVHALMSTLRNRSCIEIKNRQFSCKSTHSHCQAKYEWFFKSLSMTCDERFSKGYTYSQFQENDFLSD